MTTGLQLAILSGSLVGLGLALLLWRFAPARADAADVARRYSPQGMRDRAATLSATTTTTNTTERLGVWGLGALPASWWGRTPTRELALLRIPLHRHYGTKILFALSGLLIVPIGTYALSFVGLSFPILVPTVGSLALAALLFVLP